MNKVNIWNVYQQKVIFVVLFAVFLLLFKLNIRFSCKIIIYFWKGIPYNVFIFKF